MIFVFFLSLVPLNSRATLYFEWMIQRLEELETVPNAILSYFIS